MLYKAHPQDQQGKELIQRIYAVKDLPKNDVKIAYLANYDIAMGALLTAGVDVWLNTPQPPLEALRHQWHESGAQRGALVECA